MYSLVNQLDAAQVQDLTRQCFEEMRAAGITTVGEVGGKTEDRERERERERKVEEIERERERVEDEHMTNVI